MELEKCPFCGNYPEIIEKGNDYSKIKKIIIRCPECRIQREDWARKFDFNWVRNVAIKAWNTRVSPWIKCEDGLPKPKNMEDATSQYMNIHYAGLYKDSYTYGYYVFGTGKWYDSAGMKILNVLAWMPIPEFKEE